MASRRDGFSPNFNDVGHQFRDPSGNAGVRNFHDPRHGFGNFGSHAPLYAPAGAAPVGGSGPLIIGAIIATVLIIGAIVAIPLIVVFGINAPVTTTTTTTPAPTVVTTVRTARPVITNPVITVPAQGALRVRCPSDITQDTDSGQSYAVVTWSPPTVLDQISAAETPNFVPSILPNTQFPIGERQVTYSWTSASNVRGTCSFKVTVLDKQPPIVQCPVDIVMGTDPFANSAGVDFGLPTVVENSLTETTIEGTYESGIHFPIGSYTVTYFATDMYGNRGTCSFTITVEDREDPRITCPSDREGFTNSPVGGSIGVTWPSPTVEDNSGDSTLAATCIPASGSAFSPGTTLVTCTASDAASNDDQCTFNVRVTFNDTLPPTFQNCPSGAENSTGRNSDREAVYWTPPTATDNSLTEPTITSNMDPGVVLTIGKHEIVYTAVDEQGNVGTCTFYAEVLDEHPPQVQCLGPRAHNTDDGMRTAMVTFGPVTTYDNSGTSLVTTFTPSEETDFTIGEHTITITVFDPSNNNVSCEFTLTIVDNEKPSITCPDTYTVRANKGESFTVVSLPDPIALTDNSEELVTVAADPANNTQFNIGQNEVNYTATDPYGNQASCIFTVEVVDSETPDLSCPDDISQTTDDNKATAEVTFAAIVIDNAGLLDAVADIPSGSNFDIGETLVTFTAEDGSGNKATCNFTVTITDDQDPNITCPDAIVQDTDAGLPSAMVNLPPASVADNSMQPLTTDTVPSGSDPFAIGTHSVMYTVTDESSNSADCNVTVTINDEEKPTATEPVGPLEVLTDAGQPHATVNLPYPSDIADNSGGVVDLTTSPANNSELTIGTHEVNYTLTDPSGNVLMFTLMVTVKDEEKPELVCPDDIVNTTDKGMPHANVTFEPKTLTDNDGEKPSLESNHTGDTYDIGTTIVELTATDTSGNTNTCTFSITINDEEPPVLNCPANVTVYSDTISIPLSFSANASWNVSATDNSGLALKSEDVTHVSGSTFEDPTTVVTYTAVDAFDNSNTCSFDVIIQVFTTTQCSNTPVNIDLADLDGTGVRHLLLSPNYDVGTNYGNGQTCVWHVSVPSGKWIQVVINSFAIEEFNDRLFIGSGDQDNLEETTLASYDGTLPSDQENAKGGLYNHSIWIRFESDGSDTDRGFLLLLDAISDPLTLYPDTFSVCPDFGGFPCSDGKCLDGTQRCDGTEQCTTDEDELDCPQACADDPVEHNVTFPGTTNTFVDIVSENYPADYPPCNVRWHIPPDLVMSLRIVVMDFQVDARDRLFIQDSDANQVGADIDSSTESVEVNLAMATVGFQSGGGIGRGFWLRVWRIIGNESLDFPAYCELGLNGFQCGSDGATCLEAGKSCNSAKDCTVHLNDDTGCEDPGASCDTPENINIGGVGSLYQLTSVNYPSNYYKSLTCEYFVTTSAVAILISFRDIEIFSPLSPAYLRIGNGDTVSDGTEITSLKGVFLPPDIQSTGNAIWLEFKSDIVVNGRGFWLTLRGILLE